MRRRAIHQIAHKFSLLLGAVGLSASAMACGPLVVDLGALGALRGSGSGAGAGPDASAAMSGAGGAA